MKILKIFNNGSMTAEQVAQQLSQSLLTALSTQTSEYYTVEVNLVSMTPGVVSITNNGVEEASDSTETPIEDTD